VIKIKVLCIVGSPRRESTYKLVEAAAEALREKGIEAELLHLYDYEIKPCEGCSEFCELNKRCKIKDDMHIIYKKLADSNGLILGSPTYFWNISGILKNFIDRSLPTYYENGLKGKVGAMISVSEESGHNEALNAISSFYQLHEMKECCSISFVRDGDISEVDTEISRGIAWKMAELLLTDE